MRSHDSLAALLVISQNQQQQATTTWKYLLLNKDNCVDVVVVAALLVILRDSEGHWFGFCSLDFYFFFLDFSCKNEAIGAMSLVNDS